MSQELEEDLSTMCNLSDGIYEYGEAIGEARGEARGEVKGEDKFGALIEKLFSLGRVDDVQRAATDKAFRAGLFKEFQIS